MRSLIPLPSGLRQVLSVAALPMWSHTHIWSYPFTPVGTQQRLWAFRGDFSIAWVVCGSRAPVSQSCSPKLVSCLHPLLLQAQGCFRSTRFEPKLWEKVDLQACSGGLVAGDAKQAQLLLCSSACLGFDFLDVSSSALKGEKVIFPTLPG